MKSVRLRHLGPPIEPVEGSDVLVRTTADWSISFVCGGVLYTVFVRKGFVFDGASIPRFAWGVIGHPLSPKFLAASLVHDVLYAAELLDRHLIDRFFFLILGLNGVTFLKASTMFACVWAFGGVLAWSRHTAESVAQARSMVVLTTES